MFGALFFLMDDFSSTIKILAFLVILFMNLSFLTLWIFAAIYKIKNRYVAKIAKVFMHLSMIKWVIIKPEDRKEFENSIYPAEFNT